MNNTEETIGESLLENDEYYASVVMRDHGAAQDGIHFNRLKYSDPETLMRHLYYSCFKRNSNKSLEQVASADESRNPDQYQQQLQLFCPRRFDGWICWDPQPAGTVAENNCPNFVLGFDSRRMAYKVCHANGSWFAHPESGREWSNYTNCIDMDDMKLRRLVNDLFIGGYTISFITLAVSLCVFFSFRTLKCTRIRIHINLFISLALSCIFWIVWYKFVVEAPEVTNRNEIWCIGLHILLHYLMLVNYFWMFCEGLHLYLVLVIVFIKDAIAMRWFFTVGWIMPVALVSAYVAVRIQHTNDTEHCWMDESHAMWLLTVPVCFTLIASLVFLIRVVRVLLTKLNSTSPNPAPLGLKKATRATLILIPLFGLQHILLPFRPDRGCELERYYQVVSAVLISLQGACVSCLFCFANHDVIFVVRCQLSRLLPELVTHPTRESFNGGQPGTHSRDIVV
ncbi:calcitonin gene-related peptide type 1 receptor isoform X2 [Toxorhynchites rutilus septentrionalis]|uniref:calcitonin gene-related peptide type 1 receptor isoform X2 n=1 Tax=Toxorhynchites rutilus septentrionalis TaxID=329112 RepID=UPI00247A8C38|nr:calcitonin gene-related peptide type 1 receptor isoform X2 [Toxorhynchites rutilus septentrionalis]